MRQLTSALLLGVLLSAACGSAAAPSSPAPAGAPASAAAAAPPAATPTAANGPAAFQVPPTKLRAAFSVVAGGVAPLWLAADEGFWQQHGLDVDLTLISGTPVVMPALLAGEVKFVQVAGDAALSVQAREPDVVGVANTNIDGTHRMMVVPSITRPEDIRGKRVGVFTRGDGNEALITKALAKFNISPEREVLWTPVGGGNMGGLAQALAAGAIDAALLTPPNDLVAERNGAHELFKMRDLGLPWAGLPVYTMRRTLTEQRPVVEAYVAGIVDGARVFLYDPARAKQSIAKWMQVSDPEFIEHIYQASRATMTDRPFLDREATREVLETLVAEQPDLKGIDLQRVLDNSVVETLEQRGYLSAR